ncbi:MAG TPA: hypothetical protein VD994_18920 [Prosthecobacter sp.]|nr:hypothetical protein [Prosthecobacter sp.]
MLYKDENSQCKTLVPQRWKEVFGWIAAGDEVQLTESDRLVARLLPADAEVVSQPDFLARAKEIWGKSPEGKALSQLISEAR